MREQTEHGAQYNCMSVFIHNLRTDEEVRETRLLLCQMMMALKPSDADNRHIVHIIALPTSMSSSVVCRLAGYDAEWLGVCKTEYTDDNFRSTIRRGDHLSSVTVGSLKAYCPSASKVILPTPSYDFDIFDLKVFVDCCFQHPNGATVTVSVYNSRNQLEDDDDDDNVYDDDDDDDTSPPVFWPGCSAKDLDYDLSLNRLQNGRGPPGFARIMLYHVLCLFVYRGRIGVDSVIQLEASGEIDGSMRRLVEMYERMGFRPISASPETKAAYDSGAELGVEEVTMSTKVGPLLQYLKNKFNL